MNRFPHIRFTVAAVAALLFCASIPRVSAQFKTAGELIDKCIQENGGAERVRAIKTESIDTETDWFMAAMTEMTDMATCQVKYPEKKYRESTQSFTVMNQEMVNISKVWSDGKTLYFEFTSGANFSSESQSTSHESKYRESFGFPDNVLRYLLDQKTKFTLRPDTSFDSTQFFVIAEVDSFSVRCLYIEKQSFVVRWYGLFSTALAEERKRARIKEKSTAGMDDFLSELDMANMSKLEDHRWVNGMRLPHSCTHRNGEKSLYTIRITKYEFNNEIDDAVFIPPTHNK